MAIEHKGKFAITVGYHFLLVFAVPAYLVFYGMPPISLVAVMIGLIVAIGLGVTAGYHRLYSHKSFKVHKYVEWVLLFFGTLGMQGSALRWSYNHRIHHTHVDTDKDPYNINRGFWYAHIMWVFEKQPPIERQIVADLLRNKLVRFQHKHYAALSLSANMLVVGIVGLAFSNFFGAVLFAFLLRMFFVHHFTAFINSIAHTWGSQEYSTEHTAVDNYIIALLTFGEGYHNYHHTFASDYRNGVKWYHYDPTKWLIWTLSKIGLASDLRKVNQIQVQKRLLTQDKKLLLGALAHKMQSNKDAWEVKIDQLHAKISERLNELQKLYLEHKQTAKQNKAQRKLLHYEMKKQQVHLHQDAKEWSKLLQLMVRGNKSYAHHH